MAQRKALGFLLVTFWTDSSSVIFIGSIQTSPLTAWSGAFLVEGCVLSALLLLQLLSQWRIPCRRREICR